MLPTNLKTGFTSQRKSFTLFGGTIPLSKLAGEQQASVAVVSCIYSTHAHIAIMCVAELLPYHFFLISLSVFLLDAPRCELTHSVVLREI
jgi:hypothetical protein